MVSVHNICRPSAGQRHSSDALNTNRVVTVCFFMHSTMRIEDKIPFAILCQFSLYQFAAVQGNKFRFSG